jgi:bisphosphoglycerate-independent phosphoglycerate mutase (AlkP superfamily)
MGNSEVGHNALGAGKIYAQGALLVGRAIKSGAMFEGATWREVIARSAKGGAIHFIGLLSDGNVHSHLDHLEAMLAAAAKAGAKKLYVHALLDGRDVPPTSALEYLDRTERFLASLRESGVDARIVSGGGRMKITMDRYEADWPMVERGWHTHVPKHFLVEPPAIERPMGEILAAAHVRQLAISETQKYGHVTYFWNGNRTGMFDKGTETYVEIPSDRVSFDQRPWMKAAEITDRLNQELRTGKHQFARVNYANGDMVGHTGAFDATVVAVETVDLQLARLVETIEQLQGILVVTADHGNADEMFQRDKHGRVMRDKDGQPVAKTSHTLNPVPFLIYDPARGDRYEIDPDKAQTAGIANVTATCLELLGYQPPDDLESSLLRFR